MTIYTGSQRKAKTLFKMISKEDLNKHNNDDNIVNNDSIEEEEFLYRLNLSKCGGKIQAITGAQNRPSTRSKAVVKKSLISRMSKLKKVSQAENSKRFKMQSELLHEKAANAQQPRILKTSKKHYQKNSTLLVPSVANRKDVQDDKEKNREKDDAITGFCRLCRRAYSSKQDKLAHNTCFNHILLSEAKKGTNQEALKKENEMFKDLQFPARCSDCMKGPLMRREFLSHYRRHSGNHPYHCIRCKATYYRRCDLLRHIRIHLGTNRRFKCPECPATFTRRCLITNHLISKHRRRDDRARNFKCTECNRAFLTKADVHRHMKVHTDLATLRCDICEKRCSSQYALDVHKHRHSGEKPFKCDKCSYSARSKQLLTRHSRSHSGEKPYKCSLCSYVSASTSGLKRHMTKHAGSKPYKCPYCAYRSSNIENLRKHIKSTTKHKGLKVYRCQHCSYACDVSAEYLKHMKQQHFPNLDEESTSATKLAGILVSEDPKQRLGGVVESSDVDSSKRDTRLPIPYLPVIEMVIEGDSSSAFTAQTSPSAFQAGYTAVRHQAVTGLEDELLAVLMKIPNLQQVILAPGDGDAPVTLVIGEDQGSIRTDESYPLPNESSPNPLLPLQRSLPASQSDAATTSSIATNHQRFIISSRGVQTYNRD